MSRALGKPGFARLCAALAAALVLGVTGSAWAYFSATGTATAHASVGRLAAPAITAANPGAGTVALSWTTVSPPGGSAAVAYYVIRDNGAAAGTCPTSAATATASTSCTDRGLTAGQHTYKVVAVWQTWTATSAPVNVTLASGAPSSIAVVSGSAQSSSAGAAFANPLVAVVKDSAGNPVAGVTVTFAAPGSGASATFASSGCGSGSSATTCMATTNASGNATSSTVTANTVAGTYTITASASGVGTGTSFTETNTAASAATVSTVSGAGQSATVGTAFGFPLVARVTDSYGNAVSGATVTFTAPSSGASGTFANGTATTTAVTGATGQATSSTFTANTAPGSYSVTASVAGATSATFSLTNNPGPARTLAVSGYPSPVRSGSSNSFTVTAKDQFGNVATAYTGTVAFTSSDAGAVLPSSYTFTTGTGKDNGVHTFSATLKHFGSQSITATDTVTGTITGTQTGIVVTASQLVLTAATTSPAAGAGDNLTIKAEDALGNVDTGYTGAHNLTFSGASASPNNTQPTVTNSSGSAVNFGSTTAISFASGQTTVTGSSNGVMTLYKATPASVNIVVSDGTINNGSGLAVTVGGPAAPSSSAGKYTYTDKTTPTADQITAGTGTIVAGQLLEAIETTGPHVASTYLSGAAAANGSVAAFNVDNATSGVAYTFAAEDQWGNLSSTVGPFSFTDTK